MGGRKSGQGATIPLIAPSMEAIAMNDLPSASSISCGAQMLG